MQSNSLSTSQDGYSEKYPSSGKGGITGFIRAWFYSWREKSKRRRLNLPPDPPYGIRMYVGLPGSGKTISMVEYLIWCKLTYPGIKIYTNFGFLFEDAPIENIKDLLTLQNDKGIIFAVDEVQLSFQSRQYNAFPPEMIFLLTQNRKFKKHFVCTAQLFEHVDKVFRDLTNEVIDCHGYFDRVFYQKCYAGIDYKRKALPGFLDSGTTKKDPILFKYSFFATDDLFASYDTYKVVQSFLRADEGSEGSGGNWRQSRAADPAPVAQVAAPKA